MAKRRRKVKAPNSKPQAPEPSEEKIVGEINKELDKVDDKLLDESERSNEDLLEKVDSIEQTKQPDLGKSPKDLLNKVKDGLTKIVVLEGQLKKEINNLKTKEEKSDTLAAEQKKSIHEYKENKTFRGP